MIDQKTSAEKVASDEMTSWYKPAYYLQNQHSFAISHL